MIKYSNDEQKALAVIAHYGAIIGSPRELEFLTGAKSISSAAEALAAARLFWQIASLAADECIADTFSLEGGDVEHWTHKIFNKLYSELVANGYREQWRQAESEANS